MPQPRVPTAILEQKGAYLKDPQRKRARENEPKPLGALGEPPKELSKEEKAIWRELQSELSPNVAGTSDRLAFRKLVCLEAKSRIGRTIAAEEQLIKGYITLFGMTPSDRSRVHAQAEGPKKDDPWSKLMDKPQ